MELQSHLEEFEQRGAVLVALSVDSVADSQALAAREHLSLPLLSDSDSTVTKAFGLYDPGNEIAWPAVYVLAPDGAVVWRVFLDSYKERPPVSDILAAVDRAKGTD